MLIALATVLAGLSLFSHDILRPTNLNTQLAFGYIPVILGCVCLWLCIKARTKAKHKNLVLLYTVLILPFAFSYPAWLFFIWIMYASGKYNGPMP